MYFIGVLASFMQYIYFLTCAFHLIFAGLNIVFRKMACAAKPVIEVKVEDGVIKLISKVSFFNKVMVIRLDEDYKEVFEGLEMNVRILIFIVNESRWCTV